MYLYCIEILIMLIMRLIFLNRYDFEKKSSVIHFKYGIIILNINVLR